MADTRTRKLETTPANLGFGDFLATHRAALVVLSGNDPGSEFELDQAKLSLGRGPGVDLAFEDSSMSREHAIFEYADGGFRVRDLGSTNGTHQNDVSVKTADVSHGDRLRLGDHVFQFLLEDIAPTPKTYVLTDV
ncbi:MAG: FHA domain-containing protein [Myxococcota bacterium]